MTTTRLKNIEPHAERGAGFALLEMETNLPCDRLELAIFNLDRNAYLWPSSSTRIVWNREPYYFEAPRADPARPIFVLGPEICNHLSPESLVEFTSRDGVLAPEPRVWDGVLILDGPEFVSGSTSVAPTLTRSEDSDLQALTTAPSRIDPFEIDKPELQKYHNAETGSCAQTDSDPTLTDTTAPSIPIAATRIEGDIMRERSRQHSIWQVVVTFLIVGPSIFRLLTYLIGQGPFPDDFDILQSVGFGGLLVIVLPSPIAGFAYWGSSSYRKTLAFRLLIAAIVGAASYFLAFALLRFAIVQSEPTPEEFPWLEIAPGVIASGASALACALIVQVVPWRRRLAENEGSRSRPSLKPPPAASAAVTDALKIESGVSTVPARQYSIWHVAIVFLVGGPPTFSLVLLPLAVIVALLFKPFIFRFFFNSFRFFFDSLGFIGLVPFVVPSLISGLLYWASYHQRRTNGRRLVIAAVIGAATYFLAFALFAVFEVQANWRWVLFVPLFIVGGGAGAAASLFCAFIVECVRWGRRGNDSAPKTQSKRPPAASTSLSA